MNKRLIAIFIVALIFISPTSYARDVTGLVTQHTDLDEKVRDACHSHCQGNRRQGRLTRVTIRREDRFHHIVEMWASLKNHHHQNTFIGGGFAVYQYTVGVHAVGRLDQRTCKITVLDVSVSGDNLGIAGGARNERGKVHDVPNCHRFI
ncbi:MAG: hypothetical protein AB2689_04285 [Candidatus Thiodiazotropha taylori]